MKKIANVSDWVKRGCFQRQLSYNFYLAKYFNLFMGAYRFKGITEQQQQYILKKLWSEGKIASFIVEGTKTGIDEVPTTTQEYPNGMIAFCPFAPFMYDIYDWPVQVNLINVRGATFIPTGAKVVNKDVVIGYAQKNKKSVLYIAEYFIQKIVDVDMTIRVQLKSHKVPWLVATTPENETKMKALFDKIENDDDVLYLSASEIESIKSLMSGNAYIIDKLYQYKQALENEFLTYLGIDNLGIMEKKEHLTNDEVASNNDLINDHSDNFLTCLKAFCEQIRKTFGYEIDVEATSSPVSANKEAREEEEEEGEDEDE